MELPQRVSIIEVGPRDGLQNEKQLVPAQEKIKFIQKLKASGIQEMELTSFVSPKWVPQMSDAEQIIEHCLDDSTRNLVLVPNEKGVSRLLSSGCKNAAFFVGVSHTFNQKNINKSTRDSMEELAPLIKDLKRNGFFVRACLSTAFYCPYEGKVDEQEVLALSEEFAALGVDELSVADTIGLANPQEVFELFSLLKHHLPSTLLIAAHFHDTRGMALANIFSALQAGIDRFDTSAGGLGGCPFAPGATGNVATEDAVFMLNRMGISTGIQLEPLLEAVEFIAPFVSRGLQSRQFLLSKTGKSALS
ncbi:MULTISPECIES: hydroxymethylglutaryl-CoA lyase [Fictibacillus]|uniref:Hydroxymethylglutaryl-CoA lyase n=1 Tax=Fictibacillus enclensis TaxID=1017270 RepID=A0A0V8JFI4_9BACL|nr:MULTISPECIES: hydroxymethylglutaryl-CoA lyase [Fictibacillus]KSU85661.1 hydroxymethylglutaryl-CoA lyase [Fictibacillus enclensis]RXY98644.1 hydroxymethylglutaryl-CoA lyase [Fictibacillus sp. S7]SCC00489.1 hydroxymethylglutaryl-CoA lyase [Fictibacillus enclensis]